MARRVRRSSLLERKQTEADVQRDIVRLLVSTGWTVYSLSQGYRKEKGGTRQTPGIPDLYAFHQAKQLTLWVEVKPEHEGRRLARLLAKPAHEITPSQVKDYKRAVVQDVFRRRCEHVGQPYAYGTVADVLDVLITLGFPFPKM